MNEAQRQQMLRQLRGLQAKVGVIGTTTTRFDRELTSNNILDRTKVLSATGSHTAATAAGVVNVGGRESGPGKRDPMYDLEIEFSDDGNGFGNPLVNPTAGGEYYV